MRNITNYNSEAKIIIVGDFNIDLFKYHIWNYATEFVDEAIELNYSIVVSEPTRITHMSNTLIDNILLKGFNKNKIIYFANLELNITDHNALLLGISLDKVIKKEIVVRFRPFNKGLIDRFNSNFKKDFIIYETEKEMNKLIKKCDFSFKKYDIDKFLDDNVVNDFFINRLFSIFSNLLLLIQNTWFPMVNTTIKTKRNEDWCNYEIKQLIKQKNKKYKI